MSNEVVKIGRTSFNKDAFKGMNETEFKSFCKENKVILPRDMDLKEVFKKVVSKTINK